MKFIYVMDPMCGWCYGFQPELEAFLASYPAAEVTWIMGGLAPDTDQPMDESLQQTIASYWHTIEAASQVRFNHDFWVRNTPRRSTYAACRAVIAAERLAPNSAQQMVKAIQTAYYQEALNPSLDDTLIACATGMGIEEQAFISVYESEAIEQQFQQHLATARQLGVRGFPALFYLDVQGQAHPLALGFTKADILERHMAHVREYEKQHQNSVVKHDDASH